MGKYLSKDPDQSNNKWLSEELQKQKNKDKYIKKLLFLGSGGSGKSTLFKQLRTIHGNGWSKEDRLTFIDHIHAQIIEQMKLAIECIEYLAEEKMTEEYGDDYKKPTDFDPFSQLSVDAQNAVGVLRDVKDPKLNGEIAEACKILWNEPAIRDVYEQRAKTKIEDSSAYFWDKIDTIMESGYCPDEADILLVRYRTTGVIDQKFTIRKNTFHIFDVGGQKSERKKWIHCFEAVSAVIFVISLSAYDSVMFEDEGVNEMTDALELFANIANNTWFTETGFVLIFNKCDLFKEKIKKKSLKICFGDDYDENIYYNECKTDEEKINKNIQYIKHRFISTIKSTEANVYAVQTCACDLKHCEEQLNLILPVVCGEEPPMEILIDLETGTMKEPTMKEMQQDMRQIKKQINELKLIMDKMNKKADKNKKQEVSAGEKILRAIGKLVYYLVITVYVLHIALLYPFLYLCFRKKLSTSAWLFQKIPIEDAFYGTSILLTTVLIVLSLFIFDVYTEIQSWMVAYISWCIYVVLYLFNRAYTVYSIFSDRRICGINVGNVKASNFIIKYVVGVVVDKHEENIYTRPLSIVGGLFPALIVGLVANYILQERYTVKCSQDIVSELCQGSICCEVISSHQIEYFYEFIGGVASRIIASFGIVRIIGWLFCKGHPELRDIAQKMKRR